MGERQEDEGAIEEGYWLQEKDMGYRRRIWAIGERC